MGKKPSVCVLGGGISGLSATYFLKKTGIFDVTLYEKNSYSGGVMQTIEDPFFERGPRTFLDGKTPNLLELIEDLGLSPEIIHAQNLPRYVAINGKLIRVGPQLLLQSTLFFSWCALPWRILKYKTLLEKQQDRSIKDFGYELLGKKLTDTLLDPLLRGIYGGSLEDLSIEACFPSWIGKGASKKGRGLYTLRKGMRTLINALEDVCREVIHYNTPAEKIVPFEEGILVNETVFDYLVLALPLGEARRLYPMPWMSMKQKTIHAVHLVYENVSIPRGFGFLTSSTEEKDVLGVVFDSKVFPQQGGETRLTVMLSSGGIQEAIKAVEKYLLIATPPIFSAISSYTDYIPQLPVGHCQNRVLSPHPRIHIGGNFTNGVSVEACIDRSKQLAQQIEKRVLAEQVSSLTLQEDACHL